LCRHAQFGHHIDLSFAAVEHRRCLHPALPQCLEVAARSYFLAAAGFVLSARRV
jgi:hypothetical protein